MPPQRDIVIVGAGAVGCSIAYHLAKHGAPAQILERESIAARASGKSWAVFAYPPRFFALEGQPQEQLFSMPVGSVGPWLELFWLGYHRLPDMALEIKEAAGVDIGYGELSWVRLALTEEQEEANRTALALQRERGWHEGYWMDTRALRSFFPDIHLRVRGGAVVPYLQVEPYRYTLGLAQAAEAKGVNIRQGEVVGFRKQGSRVAAARLATGAEVEADVFVLATGPWSGRSTSWLGKEMPVLINREQCIRMEVPKRLPPYGLTAPNGLTIVPKVSGDVIVGHAGLADLQTDFDASLTTEECKMMLLNDAVELLPSIGEAKLVEQRGDFEAWSPPPRRIQPVLGRHPEWDNVYIATRFGTLGMMLSLGTGRVMADLILAGGKAPARFEHLLEVLSPAGLG
ncbi:MAG TPA: FAD-binding oxidoreductase [Candidatus Methylomirabilis sp.]|nr:FAD-binding oxidoreductase [Candidatus Methylomirabilis sp.]